MAAAPNALTKTCTKTLNRKEGREQEKSASCELLKKNPIYKDAVPATNLAWICCAGDEEEAEMVNMMRLSMKWSFRFRHGRREDESVQGKLGYGFGS